ncbi:MAG TPA: hypothetical protein VGA04_27290 [Streptosporangiaceae bacterium]
MGVDAMEQIVEVGAGELPAERSGDYDESVFPTGLPIGTCQQALDTACGRYLNDPTAWT